MNFPASANNVTPAWIANQAFDSGHVNNFLFISGDQFYYYYNVISNKSSTLDPGWSDTDMFLFSLYYYVFQTLNVIIPSIEPLLIRTFFVLDTDPADMPSTRPFTSSIYMKTWPVGRLTFETFMPLSVCFDNYKQIFKTLIPQYGLYGIVGDFTPLMGDNQTLIGYPQLIGGPQVNICRIEYSVNRRDMDQNFRQFQQKVEQLILSTGGGFHWGQPFYGSLKNQTQNFKYFDTYVSIVNQFDPVGTFSNAFTKALLSKQDISGYDFYMEDIYQANFTKIITIFWCFFYFYYLIYPC